MKASFTFVFAAALAVPALGQEFAPMALNSLSAPPVIAAAPVLDQSGAVLGTARAIVTDQDGRPAALSYVDSSDRRLRVIAAPAVSYDARNNRLIVDVSRTRLDDRVALN